jgi:hypothetical protein
MRISLEIDYKEFLRLREQLQNGGIATDEREILQVKLGKQALEAIATEKLIPNYHCENCKSVFSTVGDMYSCPKCFTAKLIYIGPPRIGKEIPPKKITHLREAGRSDMQQGTYYHAAKSGVSVEEKRKSNYAYQKARTEKQQRFFKKCSPDHIHVARGIKDGYNVFYCENCKDYRLVKVK